MERDVETDESMRDLDHLRGSWFLMDDGVARLAICGACGLEVCECLSVPDEMFMSNAIRNIERWGKRR